MSLNKFLVRVFEQFDEDSIQPEMFDTISHTITHWMKEVIGDEYDALDDKFKNFRRKITIITEEDEAMTMTDKKSRKKSVEKKVAEQNDDVISQIVTAANDAPPAKKTPKKPAKKESKEPKEAEESEAETEAVPAAPEKKKRVVKAKGKADVAADLNQQFEDAEKAIDALMELQEEPKKKSAAKKSSTKKKAGKKDELEEQMGELTISEELQEEDYNA